MAEKQVLKTNGKFQTFEQLLLYLDILQARGKYDKALDALASVASVVSVEAEYRHLQALLLVRCVPYTAGIGSGFMALR